MLMVAALAATAAGPILQRLAPQAASSVFVPLITVPRDPQAAKSWYTYFVNPDDQDVLTTLAPALDGSVYIGTKRGKIYRRHGDDITLVLDLSARVNSPLDRGLNGMAVSPGGLYLYVLYVHQYPAPVEDVMGTNELRLLRISLRDPSFQEYLLTGLPITADTHTAGFLTFGAEGELYVGVGDDAHNESDADMLLAINNDSLYGKVLRIDPMTGGGLPDNPLWDGNPFSVRSRIFASGFRNPFKAFYDAAEGKLYVGDVGQTLWEEVNIVQPGLSYGWPCMEGNRPNLYAPQTCDSHVSHPPYVVYPHYCGGAVTGIARWRGQLLIADYACSRIFDPFTNRTVFTPTSPTALVALAYDDLMVTEYLGADGRRSGRVQIYTSQPVVAPPPRPPAPTYAITITRITTEVITGEAASPAGLDVSDMLKWDAVVHHDDHIHPDFFTGMGRVITLTRTSHPDGWVELCAVLGDSGRCIQLAHDH